MVRMIQSVTKLEDLL